MFTMNLVEKQIIIECVNEQIADILFEKLDVYLMEIHNKIEKEGLK